MGMRAVNSFPSVPIRLGLCVLGQVLGILPAIFNLSHQLTNRTPVEQIIRMDLESCHHEESDWLGYPTALDCDFVA